MEGWYIPKKDLHFRPKNHHNPLVQVLEIKPRLWSNEDEMKGMIQPTSSFVKLFPAMLVTHINAFVSQYNHKDLAFQNL